MFIHYGLLHLGESFTIPYGYGSLIWPLSGVFLGLYFLFGWPILLAAVISSTLTLYLESSNQASMDFPLAFIYGINILQLIIAKWLIERFCSLPVKSLQKNEVARFLLLSGPVATFITAGLCTLVLALTSNISDSILIFTWSTKWVGDFVSIVFLTPTILFMHANKYVKKAKNPFASISASIIIIFTVYVITALSSFSNFKDTQRQFVNETQSLMQKFNIAQSTIVNNLYSLSALIQSNSNLTEHEFSQFSEQVYLSNEINNGQLNIRALAWIPLIEHGKREAFEAELQNRKVPSDIIRRLSSDGMRIAEKQNRYFPLQYLIPFEQNKSAIGLDISTHPFVAEVLTKAVETKKPVVSSILQLAQQQNKFNGLVVLLPVVTQQNNTLGAELKGLVEVVIEIDKLLIGLYQNEQENYTFKFAFGDGNESNITGYNQSAAFTHLVETAFFDKLGQLSFYSTEYFESKSADWSTLFMMIICTIIGVIFVSFVFFIVTFNASLAKQINESTESLVLKNNELNKANQAKNLFLANISHEYRTPLNAIIGFSEVARRETKDKHLIGYLSQIQESSNILLSIVNDVLDTSKMQAGELNLENEPFDPVDAASAIVGILQDKASEKSIEIKQDYSGFNGRWALGDVTRFKQILINLINNAVKFTPEGYIKVSLECLEQSDEKLKLVIKVEDTGVGMDDAHQVRLFEPFSQAEDSTARKYGGTGLGLSIVKQLCALMDGDIAVNSSLGQGSEFIATLTLPQAKPTNVEIDEFDIEQVNFSGRRVLVVEDNKINQLVANKQLQTLDIHCDLADDGEKALVYLQSNKPDLILMDLQMPIMDGFTVSKLIKENKSLSDIPIVILSASVGLQEKQKAQDLGIYDFIHKPFQQKDLVLVLQKYFH